MRVHDEAYQRQVETIRWGERMLSHPDFGIYDVELSKKNKQEDWENLVSSIEHTVGLEIAQHGSTYSMSPEIAQAIYQSSQGIPDEAELHEDDPVENMGFLWSTEPIDIPEYELWMPGDPEDVDPEYGNIPIHGVSWKVMRNVYTPDGAISDGLMMFFLVKSEDVIDRVGFHDIKARRYALWAYTLFIRFGDSIAVHLERAKRQQIELNLGENWRTDEEATARLRFVMAFFAFVRLKITRIERQPIQRHLRRQAERRGDQLDPVVNTVVLRRLEVSDTTGSHTDEARSIDWQCQWLVSRHWRRQWYPSERRHRLIVIEPYKKGPEDKPLKVSKKLFRVVR